MKNEKKRKIRTVISQKNQNLEGNSRKCIRVGVVDQLIIPEDLLARQLHVTT